MPKPKWNLNTIYISERLQESLRPVSRCQLTTVVAPMGYGKTTAVNWYLEERAKTELLRVIRISVYSDNLAIFWKSVQDAFLRAGFDFLGDYVCPSDAAGGGLLIDAICHELEGEASCYIFIDDFHLLTDSRASGFLCKLANRLPGNVHLLVASRDRFLPAADAIRLGGKVYNYGAPFTGYGMSLMTPLRDVALNSWTEANKDAKYPQYILGDPYNATSDSSRFLYSGNYLKIGNITLGYTLPAKWTKKAFIQKLRVYVSLDNVYTVMADDFVGYTPETFTSGIMAWQYPANRTFTGGVQITF